MSLAEARRRGVAEEKIVYLHGSGDAICTNAWALRRDLGKAEAMWSAYGEAFRAAGLGELRESGRSVSDKVALFDIYSCFPVAVEQACLGLGLDPSATNAARLTQTGGLPYHGGPGSNYSCHGLCAIVERLRTPAFRGQFGCVGANGGILTEHAVGIYSTAPPPRTFSRRDRHDYADPAQVLPASAFAFAPNGAGRVLAFTVVYGAKPNAPSYGVVVGELLDGADAGKRFSAATVDTATMQWMVDGETPTVGEEVAVTCDGEGTKVSTGGGTSADVFDVRFTRRAARPRASL